MFVLIIIPFYFVRIIIHLIFCIMPETKLGGYTSYWVKN